MANILAFIQQYAPFIVEHKYIFLFVASIFEGFNTLVLAGFLVSVGGLALFPAALACFFGEIVSGFGWYTIGRLGGAKPIDWFVRGNVRRQRFVERARGYLEQHTGKLIIFAKLTLSLTILTILMAGSMRYNIKKFTLYNILGSLGWVVVTFTLGTFFGQGYKLYAHYLKEAGYLIAFVVVIIVIVLLIEKFSGSVVGRTIDFDAHLHRMKKGISKFVEEPQEEE